MTMTRPCATPGGLLADGWIFVYRRGCRKRRRFFVYAPAGPSWMGVEATVHVNRLAGGVIAGLRAKVDQQRPDIPRVPLAA